MELGLTLNILLVSDVDNDRRSDVGFRKKQRRHVPRSQKRFRIDPQDQGSWSILEPVFSFSREILGILDPPTATLSWDSRDLGSQIDKMCEILWILDPAWTC